MENINTKEYITGEVIIMRGLPGSGKSWFIKQKQETKQWPKDSLICSADHYMLDKNGNYCFRDYKIKEADELCYLKFTKAILDGYVKHIVIDNRNLQHIDFIKYYLTARMLNFMPRVISLYDGGKNNEELSERTGPGTDDRPGNLHMIPATGKGSIAWCRKKWEGFSVAKLRKYITYDKIEDICPEYRGYVEERFAENPIEQNTLSTEEHVCIP